MKNYSVDIGKPGQDIEEILDFLARIYAGNYSDARRTKQELLTAEPSTSWRNFIVARSVDNSLIGVVRIVERSIRLGSALLFCGGISSVGVHPEWRRNGVCHSMMYRVIEEMQSRGMDLSFLHARRVLDGYYRQFGYYGINRYLDLEILSPRPTNDGIAIRAATREDIPAVSSFYDRDYSILSGSTIRDEKNWNFLLKKIELPDSRLKLIICYAALPEKPLGYLVTLEDKLIELSVPSDLFVSLPAALDKLQIKYISIHPCHPFHKFIRNSFSTIRHERFCLDGGYQGLILNVGALLSKIYPDLFRRASVGTGYRQAVIFGHELGFQAPGIKTSAGSDDIIFEQSGQDIRLILGMQGPEEYTGLSFNPEKPWLKKLFPYTGFHTSFLDEI